MVSTNDLLLVAGVLFGHATLWVTLFNRVHALPLPCRVINVLEKVHALMFLSGPLAVAWWLFAGDRAFADLLPAHPWLAAYALICGGMAIVIPVVWLVRKAAERNCARPVSNHTRRLDVSRELGANLTGTRGALLLSKFPCNQVCELYIHDKQLCHPRLPESLEGLTITHLSDLHFTGKIKRDYFAYVIDRANELQSDIVAVTGDIVDKDSCLDWIPATLGRLTARQGVYFVLGNHDKRVTDVAGLRATLERSGLTGLAGRSCELRIGGGRIALAGNELPWFGPPGELAGDQLDPETFRILLSHSPDQLAWARTRNFDLMLAGHTHGGQICFPLIGPVVSPSLYGVKYASGLFYEPPTLMHVSRGISGLEPIRLNCPPELTRLTLRRSA